MMFLRSRFTLAVVLAQLLAVQFVAAEVPQDAAGQAELPDAWSQFVQEAVDGGLLAPPEETAPDAAYDLEREGAGSALAPEMIHEASIDCTISADLDFHKYVDFYQYQDLYDLPDADLHTRVGALIALGMYPEAKAELSRSSEAELEAYRALAKLLDDREGVPAHIFRASAACHKSAGLWYGVALILEGGAGAPAVLDASFDTYRNLPKPLRADVAALVIPVLEAAGERRLADDFLRVFDRQERSLMSQLRFAKAVIDLGDGKAGADAEVRSFLTHPRLREEALAALGRRNLPVDDGRRDIVLDDVLRAAETPGDEADLSASLNFALSEYRAKSRYASIVDLSEAPAFQTPDAQAEIREVLIAALENDIGQQDPMRRLSGLNALARKPDILGRDDDAELYTRAVAVAAEFGFAKLADHLSDRARAELNADIRRAELALRVGDYAKVYSLAAGHGDSESLNLVATLAAMRDGDNLYFQVFADRLTPEPESIVRLIEEDASSGRWIISDSIYALAEAMLQQEEMRERVDRVLTLKLAAESNPPLAPVQRPIESAEGTLERLRIALNIDAEGEG